jgi:hypothetical protein
LVPVAAVLLLATADACAPCLVLDFDKLCLDMLCCDVLCCCLQMMMLTPDFYIYHRHLLLCLSQLAAAATVGMIATTGGCTMPATHGPLYVLL